MTIIEKVLKSNGILTTTEGLFSNTVIIAWDDFGSKILLLFSDLFINKLFLVDSS